MEKVKYEDERILRNFGMGDPRKLDPTLQELLRCTKYSHWRYEEEFRCFVPLKGTIKEGSLHFYPFDDNLHLSEVILGPQCDLSLDAVRKLVQARYHHVVTFKARLAVKFFAVVPDEGTVP